MKIVCRDIANLIGLYAIANRSSLYWYDLSIISAGTKTQIQNLAGHGNAMISSTIMRQENRDSVC
jgi:hypothetical protein